MAPNKKLGKGLSSLLGNKTDLSSDKKNDNGLLLIPIEKIFRDENQPRKEFDKEKIEELAMSINKNGLIQPLILTKKDDDNYILVAGERRWRAAQIANLKTIPSLLLPVDLDKDEISLIENIQRENLKIFYKNDFRFHDNLMHEIYSTTYLVHFLIKYLIKKYLEK